MTQPAELTNASDALAVAVGHLLAPNADPQLLANFRVALSNLLAATLGGATVMAAGAVVAVNARAEQLDRATNAKIDRIAEVRGQRLLDLQHQMDRLSARLHSVEDEFLDAGTVGQLADSMYEMARDFERLAHEIEQMKAPADHAAE